ncbi:MAG TPA: adenylate/guanylate cyclase domain-containing protein [Enterovirga sp.]|jgi:adenylate cyclase
MANPDNGELEETAGANILVVDDNEDNRYTLSMMLEVDGHERIAMASSGTEALALLGSERFDAVLLDMMMPDINGDEVLRRIKSNPDTRETGVVMISADTDAANISRCIELGADDYLPKPFNPAILRARLSSILQKQAFRALEKDYTAKLEAEQRKSEHLLRNILPPEIAGRLLNGENNIADLFEEATVVFADVVGFAQITSRMRPYEIVACLNRLFSEFDTLAETAGVEKIKTIGDCYMLVAGVPSAQPDHQRVAIELALNMVAVSDRLRLPAPFTMRVGVHSGPVMAGVIGTRKFAYDVWGDTVNIASRLESEGRPNTVLASSATAAALGDGFLLEGPHMVPTKDRRLIEAYFVTRA